MFLKIIKWICIFISILAAIVSLFIAYAFITTPTNTDLIEYKTVNNQFHIPYKFVVPGTLPNQSHIEGYDTVGPDIYIWFKGEYVSKLIPNFKVKGGKGDKYFRNIHVTLIDGTEQELDKHWSVDARFEPLMLTKNFENGYVESINGTGLFRVFREYKGKKLGGFWDIVSQKPSLSYKQENTYKGLWLGSCHQMADGVETSCSFYVDIKGMYAEISITEDSYFIIDDIKELIENHLEEWAKH